MSKKNAFSYITIPIHTIIGLIVFWNFLLSVYAIALPTKIKVTEIGKISYGAVKIIGKVKDIRYGHLAFSSAELDDGTGAVNVLYGLYNKIDDTGKDDVTAIGIYYPFLPMIHAYYINGQIGPVEVMILGLNFVIVAFFFYSIKLSISKIRYPDVIEDA